MNSKFSGNTLRDYLRIIFRHKAVIITTFIITMISTIVGLELKTPIYQARVKMLISAEKQIESPYYKVLGGSPQTGTSLTQSEIVNSNPVLERAVKVLKLQERPFGYEKNFCSPLKARVIDLISKLHKFSEPGSIPSEQEQTYIFRMAVEGLKNSIKVEPIRDTELMTISAIDFSPEEAAKIANVVSRSYVIFDLEQQLAELRLQYGEKHPIVVQLKNNIDKMTQNLSGEILPDIEAIGPASVKIIEQAQVPLEPMGSPKNVTLLLALFMGPFLGLVLAFGFEYVDNTFKSPHDVESFLNLPLLGSIPKKGFKDKILIKNEKRITPITQSYQNLSDQIYFLMKDKKLKSVLITAASPVEKSTTIIANLGNFLANKVGHKVIIIDANLRAPSMSKVFKIPDNPGLANVLEGKISLEKASQNVSQNLTILPAGTTSLNPLPLLESFKMFEVINTAKEKYEIVFVDYANLKNIKDAYALSSYLDGIALVVNEGKTRHQSMKALIAPFEQKKANLVGVILNNRSFVIPKLLYERL